MLIINLGIKTHYKSYLLLYKNKNLVVANIFFII